MSAPRGAPFEDSRFIVLSEAKVYNLHPNQSRSGSLKGNHGILVIVLQADGRLDAAGLTVRVSSSKTWAELTDWEPPACILTSGKFQQNVDQTIKSKRRREYTIRPVLMTVFK